MSPIAGISGWALLGAIVSLALRPIVARTLNKASPDAAPPARGLLEGITAALFAGLAYRLGAHLELLAFSALVTTCVPLAALDLITRKLPNLLIGIAYVVVFSLLGLDALLDNSTDQLIRAFLTMMAALAGHGVLYAAGAIGGGDLKLVGVLAAALGWISWTATWTGLVAGWLIGGILVLIGKAFCGRKRRNEIPLGVFLITGTVITLLALGTPAPQ